VGSKSFSETVPGIGGDSRGRDTCEHEYGDKAGSWPKASGLESGENGDIDGIGGDGDGERESDVA
jgi:hypothetical protein